MASPAHRPQSCMYAVAVRDGLELFLVCRIRRTVTGDVYVLPPRPDPHWNPHVTYHAPGHAHPDDPPSHVSHWQRPGTPFQGTRPMSILSIAAGEPRLTNAPCTVDDYADVFEISVSDLRPETGRTMLSVDLTAPGGQPSTVPGARVLRQAVFRDATPCIVITVVDAHPTDP